MPNAVTWAIQTNLLAENQIRRVWAAAQQAGASVQELIVIPFSDELGNEVPELEGVVIPYGSTKLTRMALQRGWQGLCFDPDTFRTDCWNRHRSDMLNQHVRQMKVSDCKVAMEHEPEDSLWFIRPVQDLKHFDGTVTTAKEIGRWMGSTESGNFNFTADTEVIIAPPQEIHIEWRFIVVGGQVIDGSSYREAGQRRSRAVTDPDLYAQAQALADLWLPDPVCAMDIAQTQDGLKVIEFNTFNSTGFYDHDIEKIVRRVTEYFANRS